MNNYYYIIILLLLSSCTKEIDIDIPNMGTQFVVNGYIENNQPAKLLLSRSLPYFDPINDNIVIESLINDAQITISNSNGQSELLNNGFGLTDSWYYNFSGTEIIGEEGVTYYLEIKKGDTLITAQTTIPQLAPISKDSLRFLYRADDSSFCYLLGHWSDPDSIGNCIRAFSKTKSTIWSYDEFDPFDGYDDFFMPMLEANGNYSDEYVNGWEFSFPMYKGRGFWQQWGQQESGNEADEVDGVSGATTGFWNVGDSVILKWSSVDRPSWDFWYSLEFNNPAGPFGAPSNANSNINGGIGVFGGTSSEYFFLKANPELGNQLFTQ